MLLHPDFSKSCQCTPKCEGTIYRATVSHAHASSAMLRAVSTYVSESQYSQSAMRLEDYIFMYQTNKSWVASLYRLSNSYSDFRKDVNGISTKVAIVTNEINRDDIKQAKKACLITTMSVINNAISVFNTWEKNTYFINYSATLYYESFISRMANDVVRGFGNLDNFASGFGEHLNQIGIAADKFATCNDTKWADLSREIQSVVEQTNDSFIAYCNEYQLLSYEVTTHRNLKAYQLSLNVASQEHVRWAIRLLTVRFYMLNDLWRFENRMQHMVHIAFLESLCIVSA